ncbi:serine hydrolase domain-containing protein [Gilvimarinus sp. SDUM040013]|uniref:Serine hydrolase domain-containing protein n=1 Tax=Gilvimarinus gilvus TaxID=3058038 RepID=A0ABU4S2Q7_9GAMM|nr:serine hydrolase domain-containing protein [Gilvimarinus sp. SDUM040013]MDO3384914.1 serine hydrolase domain-containing protein [Gilvimarinus sp. SDUM040013]MDX6851455.1 serine hydrolase domain-containing protein [Gilvimarinus sp. SDUM040013]
MKKYRILLLSLLTSFLLSCGGSNESNSSGPDVGDSTSDVQRRSLSFDMDGAMGQMMQSSGASAMLLAVAKDGEILYENAFGFQDAERTIRLRQDALMRTASSVKPVTAAAMHELEKSGVLALSDHVFCTGINSPCWLSNELLPPESDPRAKDITILQLIEHAGGWYLESGSVVTQEAEIRDALGLSGPPTREDIVRFIMRRPLDFTPGEPDASIARYSNFGYLLLGMIIEQASQTTYVQYVQTAIMAPLGVSDLDFDAAESKPIDRDPREPHYISDQMCPSIFTIGEEALCVDEGLESKNWVAVGQSVSTAGAMALFAQAYELPGGEPLQPGEMFDSYTNGTLWGTSTLVRQFPNGVSYALFVNRDIEIGAISYRVDTKLRDFSPYD